MYTFDVLSPETLQEALEFKNTRKNTVSILVGGTDLLVGHRNGKKPVRTALNLWHIKELGKITWDQKGVHIGATVTYDAVIRDPKMNEKFPSFAEAAKTVGSVQIRNMATIVGNVCNASPAADSTPLLYCANATVTVRSLKQEKEIPIESFIIGPGAITLPDDSLVISVNIPDVSSLVGGQLSLRQRIPLSINKVSFSVLLKRKDTDYIEDIRMALGAVAPTVIRVKNAEEYIKGRKITPDVIKHVGKLCSQVSKPITDVRSNIDYRKAMCGVLAERLLKKLLESNS